MSKTVDLTNRRFGRLVALRKGAKKENRNTSYWDCGCDCGNIVTIRVDHLTGNRVQSCGCVRNERIKETCATHGMSDSDEYNIWQGMKKRCYDPKSNKWHLYGGRGITICDEWKENFEAFYRDMGPRPSKAHSIDRKDGSKNYCKDNCRWATPIEQANNTSTNSLYTRDGKTQSLAMWCRELEVDYSLVHDRLQKGWNFEVAVEEERKINGNVVSYNGETKLFTDWCRDFSIDPETVRSRMKRGMLFEEALKVPDLHNSYGNYTMDGVTKTIAEWAQYAGVTFRCFVQRLFLGWTFKEATESIQAKVITFNTGSPGEEPETHSLDWWCGLFGLEKDSTYLKVLRGESFENIIKGS